MENRKFTKKEGFLLLLLLILAAGLYLGMQLAPAGSTVILEQDGTELRRVTLNTLREPETVQVGEVFLEFSREGARFVSSPCPDQVCVHAGRISRTGESAVCLPERISLRVIGGTGTDAVTG